MLSQTYRVLFCLPLVLFLLTSCSLDTRSAKEIVAQNQRDRESRYYNKALGYTREYEIKEYKFLGVEFFRPLDFKRYLKYKETKAMVYYKAKDPGSLFDRTIISTDKKGYVISALGAKFFPDKGSAKAFLRKIHLALTPQFPWIRERTEKEDSFSVHFLPKHKYIEKYARHWKDGDRLERDMQFGYKSSFWYLGNFMPDDKLQYISLNIYIEGKDTFVVVLSVMSKESVRLTNVDRKKELKDISKELLYSK